MLVSFVFGVLGVLVAFGASSPVEVGLSLYSLTVAWMYLHRRPAESAARWWDTVLAVVGTFLPFSLFWMSKRAAGIGAAIQVLGLLGMAWSAFTLATSLGIAPADRGLIASGPYRYVRHPMYLSEVLFGLGCCLADPTRANVGAWLLLNVVQVIRALREEHIIEGYSSYTARVRWRFIPHIA
jgi:protein-S-isoprenylcysteine O-methyltransferase Ste14